MPALIVVAENHSTNPNIKDICRRWSAEGFLVLGVDYVSPVGGNPVAGQLALDRSLVFLRKYLVEA
jgi:dienelactone hydrolase